MDRLKPKAVIFDLGSTLIEYEAVPWDELSPVCVAAARRFLSERGFAVPGEPLFDEAFVRIRQVYRERADEDQTEWDVPQVLGDLLREIGIGPHQQLLDETFDAYYQPVGEQLFVFDDAIGTL